jgi:hypothetical protein
MTGGGGEDFKIVAAAVGARIPRAWGQIDQE